MFKLVYISLIALSGCGVGSSSIAETNHNTHTPTSTEIQQKSALSKQELSKQELGTVITLTNEHVARFQNLTLRLIEVEDSRCAIGVSCIWAGQLVVSLEVTNENSEKVTVKLIRKREPEIANAFGYNLLLLEVEPHPKEGKVIQLSDQVIKLKIVKAT